MNGHKLPLVHIWEPQFLHIGSMRALLLAHGCGDFHQDMSLSFLVQFQFFVFNSRPIDPPHSLVINV